MYDIDPNYILCWQDSGYSRPELIHVNQFGHIVSVALQQPTTIYYIYNFQNPYVGHFLNFIDIFKRSSCTNCSLCFRKLIPNLYDRFYLFWIVSLLTVSFSRVTREHEQGWHISLDILFYCHSNYRQFLTLSSLHHHPGMFSTIFSAYSYTRVPVVWIFILADRVI